MGQSENLCTDKIYTLAELTPKGVRHSVYTPGLYYTARNGRRCREYKYSEAYRIGNEDIELAAWTELVKEAAKRENKEDLYNKIKDRIKNNWVWLKNEQEIELLAAECLVQESYKHWKDFVM